jgi:ADP-ribosylglycohydrolase
MGIGHTVYKVVSLPQFTSQPHKAAELIWKLSKQNNASNGAIMRTSILGTYEFWDYKKVESNTEKIAKVTHWDSRCVGSCVVIAMLISSILFESKLLNLEQLCLIADKYDDRIKPYIECSFSSQIEQLNLDDLSSLGYTLKAMSAGLWTYFNSNNFEDGILKVINEGGDADTNACVAGSILGAKYGYKSIPEKYINGLINRDVLENKYNEYIEQLCKSYERHSKI